MAREDTNAALAWAPGRAESLPGQPVRRSSPPTAPHRQPQPRPRRQPRVARAVAWLTVIATAMGTGVAYGYLWLQAAQVEATQQLQGWRQQLAREQQQVDELRQQLLQLASPAHIEAVARQQLGMVDEPQLQLVVPTPTSAATRPQR